MRLPRHIRGLMCLAVATCQLRQISSFGSLGPTNLHFGRAGSLNSLLGKTSRERKIDMMDAVEEAYRDYPRGDIPEVALEQLFNATTDAALL